MSSNLVFDIAETEVYDKREGEIIIKSGELSETVHVYQTGQAILLLTQNEYPVTDKGDTIAVEIKSNFDFDVQMPDVDWIAEDTDSRGVSSHTLYYKIAPNESEDSRQAEIVYLDKNSSIKDTLRIVQAPKGAIVISQKVYDVTAESETVKVEFNTNINFEYSILDSCEWVKPMEDSRALKQYELSFKVDENWSGAERTAKIVLFDSLVGISDTIVVNQSTIPDNEIWYRTTDGLVWPISEYEMPGMLSNTYTNGKGVVLCNNVITEIKDYTCSQSSDETNTLTDLILPKTLEYIGALAFGSTLLKRITIPAGVKTIGNNAFCMCTELEEIVFNERIETIDYSAFHSCDKLKTIAFPASFKSLGNNAFSHCTSLEAIYVDGKNPYFSSLDGILYDKNQNTLIKCPIPKTNVEIPLTVTTIGESAFYECEYLKEINIPASVVKIDSGAFSHCSQLKEIVIPNSVKDIGESFISYCEALDAIVVANSNPYFSSLDGVLYNKDYTSLLSCPISKSNVSIPTSVKLIGNSAFLGCGNLGVIELPENLEVIGDNAFGNCDSIKNIKIPDKVTTIGNSAFGQCRKIEEVVIPDNVTSLGDNAFNKCLGLKSITLSKNIKNIGEYTFFNCYNLIDVVIPEGVVSIGNQSFAACHKLENVTIPNTMETIGYYAFRNCKKMENITIPSSVTYIGCLVFMNCESLSAIYCEAITPPAIDMFAFDTNKTEPTIYVPMESLSNYKSAYGWERYADYIKGYEY